MLTTQQNTLSPIVFTLLLIGNKLSDFCCDFTEIIPSYLGAQILRATQTVRGVQTVAMPVFQ